MSDEKPVESTGNPLVDKLREVGLKEFERMVADGEIRSLTNEVLNDHRFQRIVKAREAVQEDELIEVNVPKLDAQGKVVQKDGYVEHEKRMVFKRAHTVKELLRREKLTAKQLESWEAKRNGDKQ